MWPQAKESLAPPEAARGRKSPPLEPSERRWLSRHFYLGLAASRTVRIKFYCLNSSVCGTLLWQLWNENICCYINKQEMSQSSAIAGLQMWMRAPDTPIQWTLPSPTVIAKELGHYEKQGERGNRIGPRELRWKAWIQWTQRLASSHIVCSKSKKTEMCDGNIYSQVRLILWLLPIGSSVSRAGRKDGHPQPTATSQGCDFFFLLSSFYFKQCVNHCNKYV